QCKKCDCLKSLNEFYKNSIKKNGHDSTCKQCRKEAHKRYADLHKDKLKEQKQLYNKKNYDPSKKKEYYLNNRRNILKKKKEYNSQLSIKDSRSSYLANYRSINSDTLCEKRKKKVIEVNNKIFDIYGKKCNYCGETNEKILTV